MAEAGYRRPCARTLDRPILVFGLEPEDLVGVGVAAIALMFLADGVVGVGAGLAGWVALLKLKAGKPPGFLYSLAHRKGLVDLLPASCRVPQVLPRRLVTLSPFTGESDDELARDWWSRRPGPSLGDPRGDGPAREGDPPAGRGPARGLAGRRGIGRLPRRILELLRRNDPSRSET